jgi:hypothetical protein
MSKYENVWERESDGYRIKSEKRPMLGLWWPVYAQYRVHGANYQPYDGISEWAKAANVAMASRSRSNFERKNYRG